MADQSIIQKAYNPEDCNYILSNAMTKGDIECILGLYEEEAIWYSLVTGTPLRKPEKNFKKEYMWLTARNATIRLHELQTLRNKNNTLATVSAAASFEGRDPDGKEVNISYQSKQLLRRQDDGTWKIILEKYGNRKRN